ncbi:f-box domain protein [Diplodia corticola]|uniref:F-box domain protein n=1 Tax=Diplodia corticola TaxID=236234 RepID=A0A1J9R765_9PEZI|nr:f-box domain protein [Diplodia corticola]OJD36369.1 f-box domain protein [Diplodia corticola]
MTSTDDSTSTSASAGDAHRPGRPRPSTPTTAHLCLLRIPELAELVFQHLPPRDLLLAQRVCRTFHATIRSSPALQQRLFFSPAKRSTKRPCKLPRRRRDDDDDEDGEEEEEEAWELNPLLAAAFPPWFRPRYVKSRWDWPMARSFAEDLPWADDERRVRAFMRPHASWRRMLVTQPPLRDVQMLVKCDHVRNLVSDDYVRFVGGRRAAAPRRGEDAGEGLQAGDGAFGELLEDAPGVTMGFLYDVTQDFVLGRHVVSNFFIQWRPFLPPDTRGYVSDEDDEDDGFVDEPDDVCGFGTPSWRRRDEEPRDMLAIHLSYTAQRDATFLPTQMPQLRSKGYRENRTYRKLLDTCARFVASEGSMEGQPTDFYETCAFEHRRHGDTMLTWNMASLDGSKFAQFPWTYNAQLNYRGETWK